MKPLSSCKVPGQGTGARCPTMAWGSPLHYLSVPAGHCKRKGLVLGYSACGLCLPLLGCCYSFAEEVSSWLSSSPSLPLLLYPHWLMAFAVPPLLPASLCLGLQRQDRSHSSPGYSGWMCGEHYRGTKGQELGPVCEMSGWACPASLSHSPLGSD
eukprot:544895-Pelagomonas_calceolata.AAC.1